MVIFMQHYRALKREMKRKKVSVDRVAGALGKSKKKIQKMLDRGIPFTPEEMCILDDLLTLGLEDVRCAERFFFSEELSDEELWEVYDAYTPDYL